MEQIAREESLKNASDLECEKDLEGDHKSIACPTPQKNNEPLTIKSREGHTNVPDNYSMLADLFGHMSCSLRLLRLCKKTPTFENVYRQVEVLSKRELSHAHLAQMKYILPEGVCIDKVLVHDKKSLCMVPDISITLRFEIVKNCCGKSADLSLRRYFRSKLFDFFSMHPEVSHIPEALLPGPFGKKTFILNCENSDAIEYSDQSLDSTKLVSDSNQSETLQEQFQLYPSFRRHFSGKNIVYQAEREQGLSSTKTYPSSHVENEESEKGLQKGSVPLSDQVDHQKESFSTTFQTNVVNTPVHMIRPLHSVTCSNSETPDMKNISCTADSFMTETPAQLAPARLLPVSDVKLQDMPIQVLSACHKPAKRVLDFSLMEDNNGLGIRVQKFESIIALRESDSFPESSRECAQYCCKSVSSAFVPQEAEGRLGYSFEKITQKQAGLDTLNEKSSPMLNLVNVIHSIFQSVQRILITKEELLHKILMNSFDVVEIREVEEQIESLEKLVPDWICKKLVPTGDTVYCINKMSDLDSVRSRVARNETVREKGFY
ncbi:unnamed protein product [Sphenostylis stenocarpa]|uniref:CDT1 Geminin-binding domain-containing protein n=1 Tax=Sphenostylis stenocarpa TaxID=92480 RepID=A0AA86SCY5_9FABA|nr:unnamed protein product [Sphenostylis stenocarpa]